MPAYILMVKADIGDRQRLFLDQGTFPDIGRIWQPEIGNVLRKRLSGRVRDLGGKANNGQHLSSGLFRLVTALPLPFDRDTGRSCDGISPGILIPKPNIPYRPGFLFGTG
jgi:hypothetical protein